MKSYYVRCTNNLQEYQVKLKTLFQKSFIKQELIDDIIMNANLGVAFNYVRSLENEADNKNTYGVYKFLGDKTIDCAIIECISNVFPDITQEFWITKIKHKIQMEKHFSRIMKEYKLDEYVKYGEDMVEVISTQGKDGDGYVKMLDSVFRAIVGGIVNYIKIKGVAFDIVYNILTIGILFESSVFTKEINYYNLTDLASIFNNITNKYNIKKRIKKESDKNTNTYTVSVTFPTINKVVSRSGQTQKDVERIVFSEAMNIVNKDFDKYEQNIKPRRIKQIFPHKNTTQFLNSTGYLQKFSDYLYGVIKPYISEEDAKRFISTYSRQMVQSMIHSSVDKIYNYEKLEIYGDPYVNMCVTYAINKVYKHVTNRKYMDIIKHILISKTYLSKFSKQVNLDKLIISKENITTDILEDVFESFMGSLVMYFSAYFSRAKGVQLCYMLILKLVEMKENKLDLIYTKLFNPKNILNEILIGHGSNYDQSLDINFNTKKKEYRLQMRVPAFLVNGGEDDGRKILIGQVEKTLKKNINKQSLKEALIDAKEQLTKQVLTTLQNTYNLEIIYPQFDQKDSKIYVKKRL